ncbi:hypothetical protein ACWGCK_26830 [Streptomyces virginiae]|uniref:hypothetical protein n=1 Tax=Streptomyces virginiae TaxID=1961 RepID=UPI00367CB354
MNSSRARAISILLALVAGALIGVLGAISGKFDTPVFHITGLIFAGGWSWACLAFLVGYTRRSKIESAVVASSALAIGVVVYYTLKWLSPVAPIGMSADGLEAEGVSPGMLAWGLAAFLFGVPLGLFGNLARIPGIGGLPFRLLVPLIAFVETSERLKVEAGNAAFGDVTWGTIRVLAVLVALALVGHTAWQWARSARRRESQTSN